MINESVFNFLNNDERFSGVYKKCIELEKGINNRLYDAIRNTARQICERLFQIIIIEDKNDDYLAKLCFKQGMDNFTLYQMINECYNMGYIEKNIKDKYHKLRIYGNGGSHYNEDELTQDIMKEIHEYTFFVVLDCYSRFWNVDDIKYEFNLNFNLFSQSEIDNLLKEIPNDVLTSAIIDEINSKKILLNESLFKNLSEIFMDKLINKEKYDLFFVNNTYITENNQQEIINTFEESIRVELLASIQKTHEILIKKFNRLSDVVNITQIRRLIEETDDSIEKGFYQFVDLIASILIKNHFMRINNELSNLKVVDNDNNVVDAHEYEIVEEDNSIEIKPIEEILGIPDKCPKCGTQFKKGSTKCPNCDYDLFDELNKRCTKCGKRIPLGSKFCIRCGNDLNKFKCEKCGYENKKGTKFCIKCGNAL